MFFGKMKRAVRSILIVEDEPLVAFDNEHFLHQSGYQILGTVDRYRDFAALLDVQAPDLVITDIRLTGVRTGVDVAQLAHEREIGVLFVTGYCPNDARHLAVGCLAKPYSQRDLLLSIRAADAILQGNKPGRVPPGLSLFVEQAD